MKLLRIAAIITTIACATGASAFDDNLTKAEENTLVGKPMVKDLSVSIKALISSTDVCSQDGQLVLLSNTIIATSLSKYRPYFEVYREPDGEFSLTLVPAEDKDLVFAVPNGLCDFYLLYDPDQTSYPIKSINGFTDLRSYVTDLIAQGYQ